MKLLKLACFPAICLAVCLATEVAKAAEFPATFDLSKSGETYSKETGHGWDFDTKPGTGQPYYFSIAVPEGNYRVTLKLGDPSKPATTTVKAESRRLMLEAVPTRAGEFVSREIIVNVRTPRLKSGQNVKLKGSEGDAPDWDDKLTLEFAGDNASVQSIQIDKADLPTVYIAGDSTVTDQPREPYNSWGQMLPRFFKPTVAIANHAWSGETLKSFQGERRFAKIAETIKQGDYLLVQFGHNDMKDKSPGAGAFTSYADELKKAVKLARDHGATPVLITPMHRQRLNKEGKIENSLGDYPEAVRKVAKEENVPLIDLHAMSGDLYEAIGLKQIDNAFAPGDKTHHNNYGSYELARCVVEGIRKNVPDLAKDLAEDAAPFDPMKPDPLDQFKVPASPGRATTKPAGN
jgi:lysophospholipase L1-like esterase